MTLTPAIKRGTAMPGSDQAECNRLSSLAAAGWIINSPAVGSNATTVSYASHAMIVNGVIQVIATNTLAIVGTVIATSTGIYFYTRSVGGTASAVFAAGTVAGTIGAIALPAIPASQVVFGMTIVACTATAFNGGTNSLADGAYTVSHYNFTGPSCLAMSTELFTTVPG